LFYYSLFCFRKSGTKRKSSLLWLHKPKKKKASHISTPYLSFWEFSSWNVKKKNIKREKMFFFFKKEWGIGLCGYKTLWFRHYIYFIDIPSRISKGDKSEKGYFSYILHCNLILNINIVSGSKMLWKNISANKLLII
jgi:hypothetical protein